MKHKQITKLVGKKAAIRRINRQLNKHGMVLRHSPRREFASIFGDYYVINRHSHLIVNKYVDIDRYGRNMGVIGDNEEVK